MLFQSLLSVVPAPFVVPAQAGTQYPRAEYCRSEALIARSAFTGSPRARGRRLRVFAATIAFVASASWVNRVREPNSSAIVTLSRENRPRTPMFSAMTMPSSRAGMLPLVIISSSGKASTIVSALSTM